MMLEDYENKRNKQVSRFRSVLDYGMGVLIMILGGIFFFSNKLGLVINGHEPDSTDKILGVACFLYGAWRVYRGYKKNYIQ